MQYANSNNWKWVDNQSCIYMAYKFVAFRPFCCHCLTRNCPYPGLVWVLYNPTGSTRTRNVFVCDTFIPVPGASVSSVRPLPQNPGYGYRLFFAPARNFLWVLYACATTPGTSDPELLEVPQYFYTRTHPKLLEVLYNPILSTGIRNPTEISSSSWISCGGRYSRSEKQGVGKSSFGRSANIYS